MQWKGTNDDAAKEFEKGDCSVPGFKMDFADVVHHEYEIPAPASDDEEEQMQKVVVEYKVGSFFLLQHNCKA